MEPISKEIENTTRQEKTQIQKLKKQDTDDLQVKKEHCRKMNWKGLVTLGLRKGIALVSANSFPQASLLDVSRQSVSRADILCSAYLVARTMAFHKMVYSLLESFATRQRRANNPLEDEGDAIPDTIPDDSLDLVPATFNQQIQTDINSSQDDMICAVLGVPPASSADPQAFANMVSQHRKPGLLGATYWCGDATNASIWQRQKLQGLMVQSSLVSDWSALTNLDYDAAFTTQTAMSLI